MNINSINSVSCKSGISQNYAVKRFEGILQNGNKANVRIRHNNHNIRSMEYYVIDKKGNLVEGRGIARSVQLRLSEIVDFLGTLQNNASPDFNVLRKFSEAMKQY